MRSFVYELSDSCPIIGLRDMGGIVILRIADEEKDLRILSYMSKTVQFVSANVRNFLSQILNHLTRFYYLKTCVSVRPLAVLSRHLNI
jgi:hypothetical protein